MRRKIVQIAGSENRIYALGDDGTLWEMNQSGEWSRHPDLPTKIDWPIENIKRHKKKKHR